MDEPPDAPLGQCTPDPAPRHPPTEHEHEPDPDPTPEQARAAVVRLMRRQEGVVSRRQALRAGLGDHDIRRLVRRREWAVVHTGVYVDHTGPPTYPQRAWAAVLLAWPAALSHASALRIADGPGRVGRGTDRRAARSADGVVHVAVDRDRALTAPAGIVLHRLTALGSKAQWTSSPPRIRVEHAVIDVAAESDDELAAIAVLTDAVRSRHTSARRMTEASRSRTRIARRGFLQAILTDVAAGTCSVLEQAYLDRVERAHGLPTAARQMRDSARGTVYRDVDYEPQRLLVELDGRLFHTSVADRARDLDRDLDAAVDGKVTVRPGVGPGLPERLRHGGPDRRAPPAARLDRSPDPVPVLPAAGRRGAGRPGQRWLPVVW